MSSGDYRQHVHRQRHASRAESAPHSVMGPAAQVPYAILFPFILLFCLIGSYSINNSVGDGIVMWVFGVLGYLMKSSTTKERAGSGNGDRADDGGSDASIPDSLHGQRRHLFHATDLGWIHPCRRVSLCSPLLIRRKGVEKAWKVFDLNVRKYLLTAKIPLSYSRSHG